MTEVVSVLYHLPKKVNLVLLDDGTEAYGYDCQVGDRVLVWYDEQYHKIKCRKLSRKILDITVK